MRRYTLQRRVRDEENIRDSDVGESHDHRGRRVKKGAGRLAGQAGGLEEAVEDSALTQDDPPGKYPHEIADPQRDENQKGRRSLEPAKLANDDERERISDEGCDARRGKGDEERPA